MKIAVINESAAADKNVSIIAALEGRGHEIYNVGMKKSGDMPELLYTHTGLMAGILLNLKIVDLIVGGCGTGQGFFNAAMQYPGVFCGYIRSPLDAWLFMQINGGNCISLPLNQGYGWAGDINLQMVFDAMFSVERGGGYPAHRKIPQKEGRDMLTRISLTTHLPFPQILTNLPKELTRQVLEYPGMLEILDLESNSDKGIRTAIKQVMK